MFKVMALGRRLLLSLCLVFWGALPGYGQEVTGNIRGTITDASGAVIPGVQVTLTHVDTGAKRVVVSSEDGLYFFNDLSLGTYEITVELPGFKRAVKTGIVLHVNEKLVVDVTLQVGEMTETLTVQAETSLVQTEGGEVSNLISGEQVRELPLNGRNFLKLTTLVPGITTREGAFNDFGVGLDGGSDISSNGAPSNNNLFLADGVNNLDIGSNRTLLVYPVVDAIAEFKILRNNYSAEFGGGSGGVINLVTKSGTRDFHGAGYEFLRNDKLDARSFFSPEREALQFNQWGYNIGGPVYIPGKWNADKTKAFFFWSQEWRRERRATLFSDQVPEDNQRACADPGSTVPCDLTDLGEGFVLPSEVNATSRALLKRVARANRAGQSPNFAFPQKAATNWREELIRGDLNLTDKTKLTIRYIQDTWVRDGPVGSNLWGDDNFPSVDSDWKQPSKSAIFHLVTTFGSNMLNDFQFSYANNRITYVTSASSDPALAGRTDIPARELFPETSGSFPGTWGGLGSGFGFLLHVAPFENGEDLFQWKDDFSIVKGRHSLKTGVFFGHSRKFEPPNGGANGTAGFFEVERYSDFLRGDLLEYSEPNTNGKGQDRWRDFAVYFQDNFKVRAGLTLDFGLRYSILFQPFDASGANSFLVREFFDPAKAFRIGEDGNRVCPQGSPNCFDDIAFLLNGLAFSDKSLPRLEFAAANFLGRPLTDSDKEFLRRHAVTKSITKNHFADFEPRLGIAWDVLGQHERKLVIRAGGGIYHSRDAISTTTAVGQNPPFIRTAILTNTNFSVLEPGAELSLAHPVESLVANNDLQYFNPTTYSFTLGIQSEIFPETLLEVNYVGTRGVRLGLNRNINQVQRNCGLAPDCQVAVAEGLLDPNLARPFLGYSGINFNERAGHSTYDALQLYLNHNGRNLSLQVAYTFSKSIGDVTNNDSEGFASPAQDAFNLRAERGLTDIHMPHVFALNYLYSFPWFRGRKGALGQILDGWQIGGITTIRSGRYWTVTIPEDRAGIATGDQRADLGGDPNEVPGGRTEAHRFNTAAFALPPVGQFGNSGRNIVRGPGLNDWSISIKKNFRLPGAYAEGSTLQFRAEFFNFPNHTQFRDIGTVLGSPDFGAVTSARPPREIQFGLKWSW